MGLNDLKELIYIDIDLTKNYLGKAINWDKLIDV